MPNPSTLARVPIHSLVDTVKPPKTKRRRRKTNLRSNTKNAYCHLLCVGEKYVYEEPENKKKRTKNTPKAQKPGAEPRTAPL